MTTLFATPFRPQDPCFTCCPSLQQAGARCRPTDPVLNHFVKFLRALASDKFDSGSSFEGSEAMSQLSPYARKIFDALMAEKANMKCIDCSSKLSVDWASVNLGVFFCIDCSGLVFSESLCPVRDVRD
eukprot:1273598-Rhodomonas_salina.1